MRILAIDDTKSLRDLLAATLRQAGHEVAEAADGREGLDQLEAYKPDIVISDLNMPNCDGIEFTRAARQRAAGARSRSSFSRPNPTRRSRQRVARPEPRPG